MAAKIPAHNPLTVPVIIDDEGRQLGGGEWGAADPDLEVVTTAVDAGRLILLPQGLPKDVDPAIAEAVEVASQPAGDPSTPNPATVDDPAPTAGSSAPAGDPVEPDATPTKRSRA